MNPGPSLRLLRPGDHRATLMEATGNEPSVATAPVVVAMTSTFWRNAWRYRERAYRHTDWDAGVSLSHILAVAASGHVATKLLFGYAARSSTRCSASTGCVGPRWRSSRSATPEPDRRAHRRASGSTCRQSGCRQRR